MQIIAGLLEAVSILLCIFVVLKLGLKINLVIYMVFAGVGCLAVNFLPDGNYFGVITFAMIGKCCWRWIFMFMYRVYVRAGRLYIHTTLYSRSHLFIWEYLLYIYVSMETHTRIWPRFCIYRTNWVSQCGNGFSHLFSKLYVSTRTWKLTSQISLTFQNQLTQSCKDTVTVWLYRDYPSHYDFGTVTIFGINELWTRLQKIKTAAECLLLSFVLSLNLKHFLFCFSEMFDWSDQCTYSHIYSNTISNINAYLIGWNW